MLLLQCFACEICCRMNARMLMGFPVFSRGIWLNMPTTWIDLKSRCTVSVVLTDDGILHWSLPKLFHLSCISIKTIEWKVPRVEPLTKLMDMWLASAIGVCGTSSRIQLVNHSTIRFQLQPSPPIPHHLQSTITSILWGIGGPPLHWWYYIWY
jgi:hypothetical protein